MLVVDEDDDPDSTIDEHRLRLAVVDRPSENVKDTGKVPTLVAKRLWVSLKNWSLHRFALPHFCGAMIPSPMVIDGFSDEPSYPDLKYNEIRLNNASPMKRSHKEHAYVCRFVR